MKNHKIRNVNQKERKFLEQITDLANSYSLQNLKSDSLERSGFLVSRYTLSDYEEYLNSADHFYVLLKHNELLGFLLAYSNDRIKANEELNSYIKSKNPDPFILIKQICIQKDHKGKAYAKLLYKHLFKISENTDYFAAIVLEPYNEVSVKFHESCGFIKEFEYTPGDGISRGVWKRNFTQI